MTQFEHAGGSLEPQGRDAGLVAGFDRGAAGREVFTIRDLTKEFDVSARTLRFYEEKGLLAPRRNGEQRLYSRRDRARLRYVLTGKRVGFSLEEVREMLDLYDLGDGRQTQLQVALAKFQERSARLEQQRAEIDRAIAELARASLEIQAMLAARANDEE
ncbi:MAG TPA: MerR family DNA-binding transcriptional regulator [Xanthobacteraceae bacterium]|jgi:DNA-binding transcriptional MerR regulator|nr:MerR family DNA-binding transcriptional regulator [Xanthobacteraceae bacterium]